MAHSDIQYETALGKLRWAVGGQWSVSISPEEAAILVPILDFAEKREWGTKDVKRPPDTRFYRGEDDEQCPCDCIDICKSVFNCRLSR